MASSSSSCLVLGGGGVTGIAWEIGILKGLRDAGVDLGCADRVIGTSAGSVVGTLLRSHRDLDDLYAEQCSPADPQVGAPFGRLTLMRLLSPQLIPGSERSKLRRLGKVARRAQPPSDERVEIISNRLKITDWPEGDLRITAVNAQSGEFRVFTKDDGVGLARAVAASCAVPVVWPPVEIDSVPYMDGGTRSITNADLAQGCDPVIVLAPLTASRRRANRIEAQLARTDALHAMTISPDVESVAAIGPNLLDPARAADSAQAGRRQGGEIAVRVRRLWTAGS